MRRWFVGMALGCGFTASVVQAQDVPVQDLPLQVQVQVAPAAPAQIQIAPIQNGNIAVNRVAMDVAVMPGYVGGMSRFSASDAIVVGRVVAFEPMDIQAEPAAKQPKANYRVAIVQLTEIIHGVKKDTQTIRVGFVAPANGDPNGGGFQGGGVGNVQILPAIQPGGIQVQPGVIGGRRPYYGGSMNLQMGQDGIFRLNKHHTENFYLVPNFTSFTTRQNNPNFDNEVKSAKQLAKVMGDPVAALKSEETNERVMAAAVLLNKYRSPVFTGAPMKQVPIDAEESKLILKALGQAEWNINQPSPTLPNAMEMFNQLGVNQKDGYNPVNVRNQQDITKAMQTWLTANADKYVIQKFVADPNAKPGVNNPGVNDLVDPQPKIRPGIRPLPIQIQPVPGKAVPIKGKVQILPAPVPAPAPIQVDPPQLENAPVPQPAPLPLRRE